MKKSFILLIFLSLSFAFYSENNNGTTLGNGCNQYIKSPFIKNSNPMKAFLSGDEIAEFHATFFKGTMYRIVACSGDNSSVPFSIIDKSGKVLFSNDQYSLKPYWDFVMEGDLDCIIEARLSDPSKASGVVSVQIAFKSISEDINSDSNPDKSLTN